MFETLTIDVTNVKKILKCCPYYDDIINSDIIPAITPIVIPSTINGHLINPLVAPTYFIIEISFLLACTVNLIVFVIINTDIKTNSISITALAILTPFAIFISLFIVSSLLVIFFTFSKPDIRGVSDKNIDNVPNFVMGCVV